MKESDNKFDDSAYIVATMDLGPMGEVRFAYPVDSLSQLSTPDRHAYASNFDRLRRGIELDGDLLPDACIGFLALQGAQISMETSDDSVVIGCYGLGEGNVRTIIGDSNAGNA